MSKILSQAGSSLADTWQVEGSVAGVENLESKDVSLFEEMGGRVHSERIQSFFIELDSGAVAQSTAFNITAGGIPDSINRVLGIWGIATNSARVDNWTLYQAAQDAAGQGEIPMYHWDNADDSTGGIRWSDHGNAAASFVLLKSLSIWGPSLLTRTGVENDLPDLILRGITSAFGAGTVQLRVLVHLCRPDPGNPAPGQPSSHGLPIPSW